MKCRNCKKKTFKKIIKLGSQPISSRTHKKKVFLKKYHFNSQKLTANMLYLLIFFQCNFKGFNEIS